MKLEQIHINKQFSLVLKSYLQGRHASCLDKFIITFLITRNGNSPFNFSVLNKEIDNAFLKMNTHL